MYLTSTTAARVRVMVIYRFVLPIGIERFMFPIGDDNAWEHTVS